MSNESNIQLRKSKDNKNIRATMNARKKTFVFLASAVMLSVVVMPTAALAHTTPDQAEDTPLGGQSQSQDGAVAGFFGAVENGEAENSLLRNPTCGAHNGPDGIHPSGNL